MRMNARDMKRMKAIVLASCILVVWAGRGGVSGGGGVG